MTHSTKIHAIILFAASMLLPAVRASAQGRADAMRPIFGVAIGYEFGIPLALNRSDDSAFICDCEGTGISYSHTIPVGIDVLMPRLFGSDLGAAARLTAAFATGRFTSDQYSSPAADSGGRSTQNRFIVDAGSAHLEAQLLATLRLGPFWSIGLGPALNYRIGGTFTQREQIISPADTFFASTGASERIVASGDRLAGARLAPSMLLRASYAIPIMSGVELRSDIHARLDVNAITGGEGIRSLSVGTGVSFLFGGDAREGRIDTVVAGEAPLPRFTTSLDIYALDGAGRHMEQLSLLRRELQRMEYTPFAPVIYFERGSSAIPPRYIRYSAEESAHFTLDSLAQRDARSIYYQSLNVIGMRLRSDASASITIVGSRGADEQEAMASARAEEVRKYMMESWGIAGGRVTIRRAAGVGDRAVRIIPSARGIVEPVRTAWVVRHLGAPEIGIDPRFDGGKGMRRWDITIRQRGREVGRYSSDGREGDRDLDFDLITGDGVVEPLVAEIVAEDSAGALAAARDQLPVRIDEDSSGARSETTWHLDAGDTAGLDGTMLDAIERASRHGDSITIIYPNGAEGHAFAEGVATTLRARLGSNDRIIALHPAEPIAPGFGASSLPEEHLFIHRVTIVHAHAAVPR